MFSVQAKTRGRVFHFTKLANHSYRVSARDHFLIKKHDQFNSPSNQANVFVIFQLQCRFRRHILMGISCFQNKPISELPISIEHQFGYFCHLFGTFALFVKKGDILLILHCSETIQCLTCYKFGTILNEIPIRILIYP